MFQFTRPRGARPKTTHPPTPRLQFQFTRPRGARPRETGQGNRQQTFQFTRPRGARRHSPIYCSQRMFQFTRPRGARRSAVSAQAHPRPFQFTRPRGARPSHGVPASADAGFNSRAHEGRDTRRVRTVTRPIVSIHAPTRGATRPRRPGARAAVFQFTRPRGARPCDARRNPRRLTFQFTRPRGARP